MASNQEPVNRIEAANMIFPKKFTFVAEKGCRTEEQLQHSIALGP